MISTWFVKFVIFVLFIISAIVLMIGCLYYCRNEKSLEPPDDNTTVSTDDIPIATIVREQKVEMSAIV